MNVLVATGQRELDQFITQLTNSPVPPITYKEGVLTLGERYKPDVVVLSAFLEGSMKNEDALYQLRKQGARVMMLIGNTKPEEIRQNWIPLGVYDYITDPVTEEKIRLALEYPATLGMAEERLQQIERGELDESDKSQEQEPKQKRRTFRKRKKEKKQQQTENQNTQNDWQDNMPVLQNTFQQPMSEEMNRSIPDMHQNQTQMGTQWSFEQPDTYVSLKQENVTQPAQMDRSTLQEEWVTENEQTTEDFSAQKLEDEESSNRREQSTYHADNETEEKHNDEIPDNTEQAAITSVWDFKQPEPVQSVPLPQGYNIIVTSPVSAGKSYIAMNLATILSKQGANTELVAFEGDDDIWQYFDMPLMQQGSPNGLPNLIVSPFKKMTGNAHYRVIDLPYEEWDRAKDWNDALFLYVTNMDVVHHRQTEREREKLQGRKVLQVLNRFVSNVLDGGQEQKIRLDADIVLDDQPSHYLAMRFGRPVVTTNQAAAREFEMATKTVQEALPQSGQNNVFSINR
ncbi:hypothetical protein [Lentibacillus salinarum]|uniref:Response regulatory domain-containing protein n=1 Tax=Lentibacillus salinarum TaxID=446820 RepID=A0ABW3ZZA8_9BACI